MKSFKDLVTIKESVSFNDKTKEIIAKEINSILSKFTKTKIVFDFSGENFSYEPQINFQLDKTQTFKMFKEVSLRLQVKQLSNSVQISASYAGRMINKKFVNIDIADFEFDAEGKLTYQDWHVK